MQDNSSILTQAKQLISREITLCKTLRAMISRELEAIALDGDTDELFRLAPKKDEIISQLQLLADSWRDLLYSSGLSELHDPVNNNTPEGFGAKILALYPEDSELRALVQETREISEDIISAQNEAINQLKQHSDGLRSKISERKAMHRAAARYSRMGGAFY
ncbi:MAG: flagellar export chaperone FlgN [Synergistaceae bacterium]|nr:flagellar export chaperone FlgN [Synergistaceae bacterium]